MDAKTEIAALVERLLRDERDAWREVVDEYAGFLFAVARRTFASYGYTAGVHDVEDCVAEVWHNVLAHDRRLLHQCRERGNLLQTLHVLARNRAIDCMRARKLSVRPLNEWDGSDGPETGTHNQPAELPPVKLERVLGALALREKIIVSLFFLQRKKYREIAALTGIPQNTIGPTISRALAKMRKAIQSEATEE